MKQTYALLLMILLLAGCGGSQEPDPTPLPPSANQEEVATATSEPQPSSAETDSSDTAAVAPSGELWIQADVWADNWFAFYSGDQLVMEDSVSITTERSFNKETFSFSGSYPLSLNFIAKDFKENDTGLEYIGSDRQQMGDGGLIAQFTDLDSGNVIAVTDSSWACMVIHEAPLDKSCENESNPVAGQAPCDFATQEEPADWKSLDFDDSSWAAASVYSASEVGPKDGYDQVSWDPSAQLIWGPDLETSNTILCRLTVTAPN